MMVVKQIMTSFRLAAVLALPLSGLAIVAGAGVASATMAPGHTIATAGTLTIGGTASGGGGPVDFWKVSLRGGDVVQVNAATPPNVFTYYVFALYAPGTNDTNFDAAAPFSAATTTTNGSGKTVFDLQAPYNGTFILAACEAQAVIGLSCAMVDPSRRVIPMDPYTFTTSFFAGGVSSKVAAKETKASPTIAHAAKMPIGNFEAGGGGPVDFWKVSLSGGDVVQIKSTTVPANADGSTYIFGLYALGTNDTNFDAASPFASASSSDISATTVSDLQAPYNGTFILAVCEGPNVIDFSCAKVDTGGAKNPMAPYTFTTSFFAGGVSSKVAAKETKASPTIAHAVKMPIGNFEAGGGGPVDFWKVPLSGGDVVQVDATTPTGGSTYMFALYKGSTTDTSFPAVNPVSSGTTSGNGGKTVFDLRAPYGGTFILAVCQGPNVIGFNCAEVDSTGAYNPMNPYTFTTKLIGGHETKTSLKLSAATVTYGHEKSLKFSVAVSALFGGKVTGKAGVSDGKKTVCTIKLVSGKGSCFPSSNTEIAPGKYSITAFYAGNHAASKSGTGVLTVKK